ncbi:hypothetical protein [Cohnella nanjingensis]|uniref:Uncharacterized protein n=1 Tax=Cohnella nanjingensis TaxID=1387779 RepID=A0A7X0VGD2_9BACL|nr:hypothetical protein [Cohnella nanjingensis]MBB6673000.1 hypothetical protein [Cohnella nanjingensis]
MMIAEQAIEFSPHYDRLFDADLTTTGGSYRWMMSIEDCIWQYQHGVDN